MSVPYTKTAFNLNRIQLGAALTVLLDMGRPFEVDPLPNDTFDLLVDADTNAGRLVEVALNVEGRGITPTIGKVKVTVWRGIAELESATPGVDVEIEDQDAKENGESAHS